MININIILLFFKIVKYILSFFKKILNKDKYKKLHSILKKADFLLTLIINILSIIESIKWLKIRSKVLLKPYSIKLFL